ncbi:hypothetical protein BVC80_8965g30 [Macleaya cordata]|uniref:Protein NUCLEAR FUSION DEFECTIVE 6, chloroplastic/mitochondrial-like n=1 Tax=Macleaya cordata TaxID=56857 RepID=A0A200QAW1_MACCD|nr:hypothetical protein BVC80_8965g30 [Macleaya cordata]
MAANCARRALLSSSASATTILTGYNNRSSSIFISFASKLAGGLASAKPTSSRLSRHKLPFFSRLPVELSCGQSLMPLHSVTASALLTSMLSLKSGNWGWLSEVQNYNYKALD